MKIRIILLLIPLFFSLNSIAQSSFEKGTLLINGGIGFGLPSYYGNISGFSIPLHANLDYGINEYVSVGPTFGYARYKYDYFLDQYHYTYNFTRFGARGAFHYLNLLDKLDIFDFDTEKLDFYVMLNMGFETVSFQSNLPNSARISKLKSRFFVGPSVGFRYYATKKLGGYVETGAGQGSWANFGITFKLK